MLYPIMLISQSSEIVHTIVILLKTLNIKIKVYKQTGWHKSNRKRTYTLVTTIKTI